jgi:hypothetical protein
MQTEPGCARRLYFDGNLTEKFTINAPLTQLTLDGYQVLLRRLALRYGIPETREERPLEDLFVFRGARMYAALSDVLWFAGPEQLAAPSETMDVLLWRTLRSVDRDRYRPERKPGWLRLGSLARATVGVLRASWRMGWNTGVALLAPARYLPRYREAIRRFEREARLNRPRGLVRGGPRSAPPVDRVDCGSRPTHDRRVVRGDLRAQETRRAGEPGCAGAARPDEPRLRGGDVLTRFEDGQWVEVDGSAGVVRLLPA